ncbi:MAG: hypothetical protein BWK78_10055 [Thiotrichaceae bacterium IS1]|nr:MAG: hypothetical protein BWK78_10055 [Thiotrichaceae bacterium IS1]
MSEGAGDEWFSVIGGLAHLSENGEWKIFHTGNSELPNNDITALASDANGVWIGTVDGLAYLNNDNGEWKVFKTDNSNLPGNWIETVVSDGDGGVWIGTSARFLVMGTPMSFSDFLNSPENYSLAYSLTHLSKEGKWTIFNTTNSDLPSEMIRYLARDHDGIWICTWGGLAHLDDKGNWTIFQKNGDSFSTDESANYIEVIIDDGQDGLWIGTWGHGLAHLNNNSSQIHFIDQNNFEWPVNLENPDFTANTINSLLRDGQGDLWVGTENGLIYFNDNQKLLFNTENSSLPDNSIYALLDDGNNGLWIGTWGGLAHLSDDKKKWNIFNTENSKLPDDFVNAIVSDENGGIWIGTWGGLAHMDNHHEWTIYNSDNSKLPNDHIRCLANDGEGGIWIGGDYVDEDYHHGGGLTHLDVYGEWKTFNTDNSPLPSNIINSLVMDNERRLWVGTDNGIVYLDHSSEWIILSHTNLDIPEWMDYTFVTSLTIDNDGKGLWIGASPFGR